MKTVESPPICLMPVFSADDAIGRWRPLMTVVFGAWSPGSRCHDQHSVGRVLAQQDVQRFVGQRRHEDLLGDPRHRAGFHRRRRDQSVGVGGPQRGRRGVVDPRDAVGQHHIVLLARSVTVLNTEPITRFGRQANGIRRAGRAAPVATATVRRSAAR